MTFHVPLTDLTGAGPLVTLATTDSVYIGSTIDLSASSGYAIQDTGTDNLVRVFGTVYGQTVGVYMSGAVTLDRVQIGASGTVSGYYGVFASGKTLVENAGTVLGANFGVAFSFQAGSSHSLVNSGVIVSGYTAVGWSSLSVTPGHTISITNTGTIIGGDNAINFDAGYAIMTTTLVNSGRIEGAVRFEGGADLFDNRGGTLIGTAELGAGADTLIASQFAETVIGGLDVDLVDYTGQAAINLDLTTPANNAGAATGDVLTGFDNVIGSATGNDTVLANDDANWLRGLGGHDRLSGQGGVDSIEGGLGNDYLDGGAGADVMTGGAGNDTYVLSEFADQVIELASGGRDRVWTSFDLTLATNLEDASVLGLAGVRVTGNTVANVLTGNDGADTLRGDIGNDTLRGGGGADSLFADEGNDSIDGNLGADWMEGGAGNDTYVVDSSGDRAIEVFDSGTDTVRTAISLTLGSNVENGIVTSALGRTLVGNSLANALTGGVGADVLRGGSGVDRLTGAAGADRFQFNAVAEAGDVVTDFTHLVDDIVIRAAGFGGGLVAGALNAAAFWSSTTNAAHDASDRFIFRTTDKTLWFDANGTAAGGPVMVADLQASATMSEADILLI